VQVIQHNHTPHLADNSVGLRIHCSRNLTDDRIFFFIKVLLQRCNIPSKIFWANFVLYASYVNSFTVTVTVQKIQLFLANLV
jgi:hypothetical protein